MKATNTSKLSERMIEFMNRSTVTIAIQTSVLLFIGLVAVGGNLLVLISIYRNPTLRTITNYFVVSLAVSDILYPVTVLPLTLAWSIESRFILGQISCVFQAIFSFGLLHVSVATMAVMAINRYVCVCKPQRYKIIFSKKTSLLMIGAVWIISFTVITLIIQQRLGLHTTFEPQKIWCGLSRRKGTPKILMNLFLVIDLAVPWKIIVYCYCKIFKKIREHKRNIAPNPNSLGTSVQEIKITWTMFAVLLGYCATWIPLLIIVLVSNYQRVSRDVQMIVTYATAGSSAINPLIYGVMNPAFRQEYKKITKCQPNES